MSMSNPNQISHDNALFVNTVLRDAEGRELERRTYLLDRTSKTDSLLLALLRKTEEKTPKLELRIEDRDSLAVKRVMREAEAAALYGDL